MNRRRPVLIFAALTALAGILACASTSTEADSNPPADAAASSPIPSGPTATATQNPLAPNELPVDRSGHAGDQDSSLTADQHEAPGGDRFTFGRFERPFNAESMDTYFPYLDIQEYLIYQDQEWIYAVVLLKETDAQGELLGNYALEIDGNADGGGDWLVRASHPNSTEWTTAGVQAWFDSNDDVGGETTVNADAAIAGDGYETLLFDQGQGDDPALAWARVAPTSPALLQIAVKRSILGGDSTYMAGVWAGTQLLDPALFDLNDHFTHEQAGAALRDLEYFYPIKALYELDNACRVAVGFQPSGTEPGLCPIETQSGSCPSNTYYCVNFGSQQVCYCVP